MPLPLIHLVKETEAKVLSKHCIEIERAGPSNLPLTGPASGSRVDQQFQLCHLNTHHGIYVKAKLSWASSSQWPSMRVLELGISNRSVSLLTVAWGLLISKAEVVSDYVAFWGSSSSVLLPSISPSTGVRSVSESADSPCPLLLQPLYPSQALLQ